MQVPVIIDHVVIVHYCHTASKTVLHTSQYVCMYVYL
jgi:hypothetical protein